MIKKLKKRFIVFNLVTISIVFIIVGGILLINNEHVNNRSGHMIWHRLTISSIVFLGLALIASILLAKVALEPIKKSWKKQLDFTADASHELRTPLAVIQTSLEIILDNEDETVKSQKEWLENIVLEHQRMTMLVEDLLTLSRGDTSEQVLNIEMFDIGEVIEEVKEAFSPIGIKKGIVIENNLKATIIMEGDRKRIKQLLVILVDNGVKYMEREGRITVHLDKRNKFITREEEIILTVNDTGQGIEEEKLDKLFERFYRGDSARSQEGSGLGLAIAKWIVESHQGKIKVESKVGEGTSFIIELPAKLKKGKN